MILRNRKVQKIERFKSQKLKSQKDQEIENSKRPRKVEVREEEKSWKGIIKAKN